jgi:pimeloyl-ACP methyl ester carboxylesterase
MLSLGDRGTTYVTDTGPAGSGPPLLLLHAIGCTGMLSWFSAVPSLAQNHRVVLFDQRWHGRGPRTGRSFRLDDLADDAVAVADALGIDQFVPVGYSMGGIVAQLTWHRHPDRVAGLVLAATARNFRGTGRESTFFRLLPPLLIPMAVSGSPSLHARALQSGVVGDFAGGTVEDKDFTKWAMTELQLTSRRATLSALSAMGGFSSAPWIGDVDVPTSVVITSKDHCIPTRRQRKLAASVTGAEVFEIDGGHASCVTQHAEFSAVMTAACDSVITRISTRDVSGPSEAFGS